MQTRSFPSLLATCALLLACSGASDESVDPAPNGGAPGAAGSTAIAGAGGVTVGGSGAVTEAGTAGAGNETGGSEPAGGRNTIGGSAGSGAVGGSAGMQSTGGSDAIGGSAGTAGRPAAEASIDFARWSLQLPTGSGTSPTTIPPAQLLAGFSNEYFYVADDGAQTFMSPQAGITTPGSKHCRTEMREMTPGAGAAAWASSGTHRMTVEGKVVKLGGGTVAVGQLFNGTDSIPLCELMYTTSNKFVLLYEEAKGAADTFDMKTSVPLDTRYTFSLEMLDGKLRVTINGKEVYTRTPSAGILDNKFYFKAGNYDQSAVAGTPDKTPYSIVAAYSVKVEHD